MKTADIIDDNFYSVFEITYDELDSKLEELGLSELVSDQQYEQVYKRINSKSRRAKADKELNFAMNNIDK